MAGLGYKTFNVGDVLTAAQVQGYLQDQTVMRFASATARNTAIGANVAEGMLSYLDDTNAIQYYDGSAWQTLSTGGDITSVVAGYGLAGGGTSGDVTLTTAGGISGTNPVLNSSFNVWQRGTSFASSAITSVATSWTADRWGAVRNGFVSGSTFSRQATGDTTNLPNIQYCMRVARDNGNTNTSTIQLQQPFETVNSIPFAGKAVTFSFYARAGANYSSAANALLATVITGTGTDQNQFTAYTGQATPIQTTATLTTTWQRFTLSGTIAATATEITLNFQYTPVGTAGAADYYEITGVQLEVGSAATAYQSNGKTIQAELAACQRYYYRATSNATNPYAVFNQSYGAASTTSITSQTKLPVTMRVAPTSLDYANLQLADGVNAGSAVTAAVLDNNTNGADIGSVTYTVASGLTQYRPYVVRAANSSSAYLGFSAEL